MLAAAVAGLYAPTLAYPFVFDDVHYIVESPKIHAPFAWGRVVPGSTRPVHYLLLACNYACAGLNPWDYRLTSVAVHLFCSLTLFLLVRSTLALPSLRRAWARDRTLVAAAAAGLWALHPLVTESVTYVWQRSESLAGFFYLLTLYCAMRFVKPADAVSRPRPSGASRCWAVAAVIACLLGMGSKEIMVTAPLAVLLYDRFFVAGSLRRALALRPRFYLALAATWGLPALLLANYGASFHANRGVGFDSPLCTPLHYLLTMPGAYLHYLRLAVWPDGLCIDYAWPVARGWQDADAAGCLLLLPAGAYSLRAAWGRRPWSFCVLVGLLVLAPTSSFMPMPDPVVEHRFYLPLAGLAVIVAGVLIALLRRLLALAYERVFVALVMSVCLLLGAGAWRRNLDYGSPTRLWRATLRIAPHNPRAHYGLARALAGTGRFREARSQFDRALKLAPGMAKAWFGRGIVNLELGRYDLAARDLRAALRLRRDWPAAWFDLGFALERQGRASPAREAYRQAARVGRGNRELQSRVARAMKRLRGPGRDSP